MTPPLPTSGRDASLGRWIAVLQRQIMVYAARQFEPLGIGAGQFPFLAELFHQDGLNQEELTTRVRVDKAATTRALNRLAAAGYVERFRDPHDARMNRVYLTAKAWSIREQFIAGLEQWSNVLATGMSPAERRQALGLLIRMAANASTFLDARSQPLAEEPAPVNTEPA